MKILKNIPMPNKRWPFAEMEVGDCVMIDNGRENPARAYLNNMTVPKTGFKFTTRTIDGVLHVWRVA